MGILMFAFLIHFIFGSRQKRRIVAKHNENIDTNCAELADRTILISAY